MEKRRLLIASPYSLFLQEHSAELSMEFELQRANTEEVVNFLCKEWAPHLLVVDGDSPLFNSCAQFRQRYSMQQMGLVLITREMTTNREERALRGGCDQVLPYPTSATAFCLRLVALGHRIYWAQNPSDMKNVVTLPHAAPPSRPTPIVFGEIEVHPQDHLIKRGANLVIMTPLQFKLLVMFLTNKEQLLSRVWIKESIWGNTDISLRSIDAQISKLRKIVPELDPHLVNIYGKGYVFTSNQRQVA